MARCESAAAWSVGNKVPATPQGSAALLRPHEPRGVEPVETFGLGQVTGEGAEVAIGSEAFPEPTDFLGRDRTAADWRLAGNEPLDLLRAFLGLEGASAVDERAAGRQHVDGGLEQTLLDGSEPVHVVHALEVRHVGMPADRAGGGARRVQPDVLRGPRTVARIR